MDSRGEPIISAPAAMALNLHAARIDVGSAEHYAAVAPDRDQSR